MNMNPIDLFGINVACNMISLLNDKTFLSLIRHLSRKHRAKQTCAHDQIIILHIFLLCDGSGFSAGLNRIYYHNALNYKSKVLLLPKK